VVLDGLRAQTEVELTEGGGGGIVSSAECSAKAGTFIAISILQWD
jgi:hypothetical protein